MTDAAITATFRPNRRSANRCKALCMQGEIEVLKHKLCMLMRGVGLCSLSPKAPNGDPGMWVFTGRSDFVFADYDLALCRIDDRARRARARARYRVG